jgi:hypothetical protein
MSPPARQDGRPSFWERPSHALPDREFPAARGDASRPRPVGGVNDMATILYALNARVFGSTVERDAVDHRADDDAAPHELANGVADVLVIPSKARYQHAGQQYAASVSNLLARVFHLIRQPVALLFLSALSKSLLLVAINSRQLTNSMLVFTPGGILSEYEFRSRHSTSQLSSPNAVPLNNVRITRSHFSLLLCSRYVSTAFRSSSLSARRPWLASFCAGARDEARTHNRIMDSRRVIRLSPPERLTKPLLDKRGALLLQFRRRRMFKKLAIRRRVASCS